MAADSYGSKNEPQFSATGAPDDANDLTALGAYAAGVGNRKAGTNAQRIALSGADVWDGLEFYETDTKSTFIYEASAWVGVTSTDANGWLITYSGGKPIRYTQWFDAWAAGNAFGAAGGSNWDQARGVTLSPPVGQTWDAFIIDTPTWATTTASNQTQELLQAWLAPVTGSSTASLVIYNPTALTISNSNMTLRCGVILTPKS